MKDIHHICRIYINMGVNDVVLCNEKLRENDIKTGEAYSKELVNYYCKEYNCALIKLNSSNRNDDKSMYMIKEIINDVDMVINKEFNTQSAFKKKVIIVERA